MRNIRPLFSLSAALAILFFGAFSFPGHGQETVRSTGQPMLLVANQGDRTLSLIDPTAGQQTAAIPENAITGHEVAASPDGRTAYVPIYGNSGVGKPGTDGRNMLAIDLETHAITGTVDFGHGVRPHCPVFDTIHHVLYVTTELDNTVTIIDPSTLKIVGTIPTGQPEAHMLAISHNGKFGYTANVGPGTVSVLDLNSRQKVAVIPISAMTQRISISPDDSMVFTADQTKPQLAVIDTATNKIKAWVPLASPGYGTASTKDGRYLLVAVPKANHVAVVDLSTLKVIRTLDVPSAPQEVLVQPDGKMAYVSCNASHKVAAINLTDWKVEKLIDAGKGADGLAWANPAHAQTSSR
jgi:YVTN family beta-propeller protein